MQGKKKKKEHCQALLDSMQSLTNTSEGKKNRHRKVERTTAGLQSHNIMLF